MSNMARKKIVSFGEIRNGIKYIPAGGGYVLNNGVGSQVRIMSIYIDQGECADD